MMKNIKTYSQLFFTALTICAAVASCSTEEDLPGGEGQKEFTSELSVSVKDKKFVGDLSRSSLSFNATSGMVFAWQDGDAMTVYARGDYNAAQQYNLLEGAGQPTAVFSAENFQLKKDQMYYAFSMIDNDNPRITLINQNNITVKYSGQTQTGNANPSHLGDYDFMAAAVLCKTPNSAKFMFDHLGSTMRVVMTLNNVNVTGDEKTALDQTVEESGDIRKTRFTEMELYDSENSFYQTERYFSFATGTQGDTYSFEWKPQELNDVADRFKLKLVNKNGSGRDGVSRFDEREDGTTSSKNTFVAYMEIPPADFTGKKIVASLKGYYEKKNGSGGWDKIPVSYVGTYDKGFVQIEDKIYQQVVNGEAYQLNMTMEKPSDFKVTLKLNHMWQHGNTLDQSKATGDPGNDKDIFTPNYIYYIYCHDGKVIKPTTDPGAQAITEISGAQWTTQNNGGVYISTFTGGAGSTPAVITLQKPEHDSSEPAHNCKYHLYVVASETALDLTANVGDAESAIQDKLYNLPTSGVQTFMRDLYSTPWQETGFVGNLTDPIQDVMLYHVAAKVDLKWNSATAVKNVTATNVKNEGLYIFKPTENIFNGGDLITGYNETFPLTDNVEQWYNGRYILYLPQFKTNENNNCYYRVGLNETKYDITFTPSTTGGYTSWLRWLKKQ